MKEQTMDCKNCGLPVAATDENCPSCGAPNTGPSSPKPPTSESAPTARRWPFNPILAACCGVGVFVLFVVLCWLGWTVYAFYHSPAASAPPSKPLAAPPIPASGDTGPAYAVSDIEGGSDADRKTFDGKTITVEGYVNSVAGKVTLITDSASAVSPTTPVLKAIGMPGATKFGTKAKLSGKYSATDRSLNVASVVLEK